MEDDYIEYHIYPTSQFIESQLVELRDNILNILAPYIIDYLWHIDHFNLKCIPKKTLAPGHLYGRICFGDNIEDEWFTVALLTRLTELADVAVRVTDSDGEILLIEAAEKLPSWAQEPELSDGRVFLYKGEVHLIPIARTPAELTPLPSSIRPLPHDAVTTICQYPDITRASKHIQDLIKKRTKGYPDNWSDQRHFTHVLVPPEARAVIKKSPQLMSVAVRTFFSRDVSDLRACRVMKHFPPQKLVKTRVRLTKCLYAMLSKPKFLPDKRSGWDLLPETDPNYKPWSLGLKLTCGLEMLASHAAAMNKKSGSGSNEISGEIFNQFVKKLSDTGYFQNELEGSKKYTELLDRAKNFYQSSTETEEDISGRRFSSDVIQIVENYRLGAPEDVEDEEDQLPSDDESWLDIEPDSFDELLRQHFKLGSNQPGPSSGKEMTELPNEIKKFLQSLSEFDGVQVHHDNKPTDEMLNLDPDAFSAALKKAMDLTEQDLDDPIDSSSDDSDDDDDIDLDVEQVTGEMSSYFKDMKQELEGTKVPTETEDWTKPLDIDSAVLKNLLESYKNQEGMAGPTSTMLEPLGIKLDKK